MLRRSIPTTSGNANLRSASRARHLYLGATVPLARRHNVTRMSVTLFSETLRVKGENRAFREYLAWSKKVIGIAFVSLAAGRAELASKTWSVSPTSQPEKAGRRAGCRSQSFVELAGIEPTGRLAHNAVAEGPVESAASGTQTIQRSIGAGVNTWMQRPTNSSKS